MWDLITNILSPTLNICFYIFCESLQSPARVQTGLVLPPYGCLVNWDNYHWVHNCKLYNAKEDSCCSIGYAKKLIVLWSSLLCREVDILSTGVIFFSLNLFLMDLTSLFRWIDFANWKQFFRLGNEEILRINWINKIKECHGRWNETWNDFSLNKDLK